MEDESSKRERDRDGVERCEGTKMEMEWRRRVSGFRALFGCEEEERRRRGREFVIAKSREARVGGGGNQTEPVWTGLICLSRFGS